jgi:hypothetical protein
MAMPVGSMISRFRPEFEGHIENAARRRADERAAAGIEMAEAQRGLVEGTEGDPQAARTFEEQRAVTPGGGA